jgi:phosphoglycerol transferase MdoB-like AlkP superfamily enzyme
MKKIKSFVISKIKSITKFNYKQYVKTNVMFFTTVITLLINATLLRVTTVGNVFEIKPVIADLAVILLILCPAYLIKPKKQIIYFMSISILMSAICIINSIYFTYYSSFASVSLLSTSLQVVSVADAVTENVMELSDFIFVWQPLVILFVHFSLKKKNYYHIAEKVEKRKKRLLGTFIGSLLIFGIFMLTLTPLEIGRLVKQWNREFLVMKFGIYTYQINDIISNLEPKINAVFGYDNAARMVKKYYEEHPQTKANNQYTNMFKGKNILTVHAESIQEFVIGLKINGEEVTPNLNKLSQEGLYFSNFYSQVGVGTSSDAEFTLNTSLMPATNGTVFISYWNREYLTIPKMLKEQGYYNFSMHGNNGDMWNRLVMHKEMGYDRFYNKKDYEIDDTVGLGLSDKSFFRQSIPIIKNISEKHQNFYGTLIMLSNHTPFVDGKTLKPFSDFPVDYKITKTNEQGVEETVSMPYMEGTTLGNYLKSVHYSDEALGELMVGLENQGLLDNTVVVIYGDHDARLPKADYNRLYNYDPYTDALKDKTDPTYKTVDYYEYELNRKVPLIILSKNIKPKQITKVMGMYDVLPTLGNMFGFSSPYQLGHDIFSINDNMVVFANGNWITGDVYYNSQKNEFKVLNDTAVISQDYINKYSHDAEEKINVSNDIIIYDYIRKSKESQAVLESYKK